MIQPDANLLLYAYDSTSPFHAKASTWLTRILTGTEKVIFCVPVVFAFLRLSTSSRVYHHPLSVTVSVKCVKEWLAQPNALLVEMLPADVERALDLLLKAGTAGNLTTDAQLAALSLRLGAVIHSADSDFDRFSKVKWLNPLAGK